MKSHIRIIVVGDAGTGKSSLIATYMELLSGDGTFPEKVPRVLQPVAITPEDTQNKVFAEVVDTASDEIETLHEEYRHGDVVMLLYECDNKDHIARLTNHWLPDIMNFVGEAVPVVLVGTKIDLRGPDFLHTTTLVNEIMPIINNPQFRCIETCIELSSRALVNVYEAFSFAQSAVLHPTGPVYDASTEKLTQPCVAALTCIFRQCDVDRDGVLSDEELQGFQAKCFGARLQDTELDGVKKVVQEAEADGIRNGCLTLVGFLFLHKLFIQRGRVETTWRVLRTFGYEDDLSLREDYDLPVQKSSSQSIELTEEAAQFLLDRFREYDKDRDGALSQDELNAVFEAGGHPWGRDFPLWAVTNEKGFLTEKGWHAQWNMTALLDAKAVCHHLTLMGFRDVSDALSVTRKRKLDRKKKRVTRHVFRGFVLGAPGSGKTAFLCSHIHKSLPEKRTGQDQPLSVANQVEVDGEEYTLVLTEFPQKLVVPTLSSKETMDGCDLVVMTFARTDPTSFSYAVDLFNEVPRNVPVVFVATKSDLVPCAGEEESRAPDEFCERLGLPLPVEVSTTSPDKLKKVCSMLAAVALNPSVALPDSRKKKRTGGRILRTLLIGGAVGVIGYLGWRYLFKGGDPPPKKP